MNTLNLDNAKKNLIKQLHSGADMDRNAVTAVFALLESKQREMAELLFGILDELWGFGGVETNSEIEIDNFLFAMETALQCGLDPNYLYEKEKDWHMNILWEAVCNLKWGSGAPKAVRLLLEHGGDPNLLVDDMTVFWLVDDFIYLDGDELQENVFLSWLQLAAYGGDENNKGYLPLRMIGQTTREELKQYENYTFSFEDTPEGMYKRTTVMLIIDRRTGEKVAVNETPFG